MVVVLLEMDYIYTNMINTIEYRKAMVYLAPHPRFVEGDGLFLKHGNDISDGAGLLMGRNSPFKNISVLGWLLLLQSNSMVNVFSDSTVSIASRI